MAKIGGSVRVPGIYYVPQDNLALVEHIEGYLKVVPNTGALETYACSKVERPIYRIALNDVPKPLESLISQIHGSDGEVVDTDPSSQHGSSRHGSMRDVHQNNDKGIVYLPKLAYPAVPAGKTLLYHDYIITHGKASVQNKQKNKSGATGLLTGYIEYTVVIAGCSEVRLIYDYVNERFFFSPNHYKPWARLSALTGSKKPPKNPLQYRLSPQSLGLQKTIWDDNEVYGPHVLVDL